MHEVTLKAAGFRIELDPRIPEPESMSRLGVVGLERSFLGAEDQGPGFVLVITGKRCERSLLLCA